MAKNIAYWLQDVDTGYLTKVDLEDRVSSIHDEFDFYKAFYNSVRKQYIYCNKKKNVVLSLLIFVLSYTFDYFY